ncbi:MAG: glycosyltransferase family 39 protein [Planctomycetota bacterium]
MARALRGWFWLLLGLGLAWRIVRYARGAPFWCDESYLNLSILHRDYEALLDQPLEYSQIAPLLFVWAQRTALEWFGGGEYSLRLLPFVASLAALGLFAHLAWAHLPPRAAALAVGLYAVSYRIVRHATDAKPYAVDALVAILLLWVGARWLRRPGSLRWTVAALVVAVPGVWLSYPAIFVAGGVGLAAATNLLWRRQTLNPPLTPASPATARAWALCGLYNVLTAASFAGHLALYGLAQSRLAASTWLEAYWSGSFPPPGLLAGLSWFVRIHTGRMFGYPIGGEAFGSVLTLLASIVGAVWFLRRRSPAWTALLLAPFALNLVAAVLHKYPYGGSTRLTMHLAAIICLLAGAGLAALIERIRRPRRRDLVAGGLGVFLLGLAGLGTAIDATGQPRNLSDDELVRPAVRDLVAQMGAGDLVLVANRAAGSGPGPDAPRFDPTARYYLELYHQPPPVWLEAGHPARPPDWVLLYANPQHAPTLAYVQARLAEWDQALGERFVFSLSRHWGTQLELVRVRPGPPAQ